MHPSGKGIGGQREFWGLRDFWVRIREVIESEEGFTLGAASKDLIAEKGEQIGQRGTSGFASPLGERQVFAGAVEAGAEDGGQQQQATSSDLELGQTTDGLRAAHLSLGHAQQRLLLAVVALNLPTLDVGLH